MVLEEGIPHSISLDTVRSEEGAPSHDACGDSQVVVHQKSEAPVSRGFDVLVTPVVLDENDIVLANLVKDVLAFGKGKGSPLPLGLMHRPFKQVSFTPLRSGQKIDQEKIKLT